MASISYDDVYTRFYLKVEAFDFITSDELLAEFMRGWLRSAIYYPYTRRLFKSISLDDELSTIEYEMSYVIDDESDKEFVVEVFACGMVLAWLEPKIKSITNIYQNFTTSEAKFYSQSQHLSELRALYSDEEVKIRGLIRDRGYLYNNYLDGKK